MEDEAHHVMPVVVVLTTLAKAAPPDGESEAAVTGGRVTRPQLQHDPAHLAA
jgi:hypothetical protein